MKAKLGVWTPWAIILCLECHGPKFHDKEFDSESEVWETLLEPQELKNKAGITACDKCGDAIQLDYDIAAENNFKIVLKGKGIPAAMEQTGGMNHALTIPCIDGGWYYVTFNFDGDYLWVIRRQDEDGEAVGEPYRTKEIDEMEEHIYQLEDIEYNFRD